MRPADLCDCLRPRCLHLPHHPDEDSISVVDAVIVQHV